MEYTIIVLHFNLILTLFKNTCVPFTTYMLWTASLLKIYLKYVVLIKTSCRARAPCHYAANYIIASFFQHGKIRDDHIWRPGHIFPAWYCGRVYIQGLYLPHRRSRGSFRFFLRFFLRFSGANVKCECFPSAQQISGRFKVFTFVAQAMYTVEPDNTASSFLEPLLHLSPDVWKKKQ